MVVGVKDRRQTRAGAVKEESMRFAHCLWSFAAIVAGLIVLTACTVVVEDTGPRPGPGSGPGFCTREYRPVCASRFGEQRTFTNACLADRSGWRIVHRGECRRGSSSGGPRICTMDYRPVCATRRGNIRTFSNACQADAAGWRVVRNRPC